MSDSRVLRAILEFCERFESIMSDSKTMSDSRTSRPSQNLNVTAISRAFQVFNSLNIYPSSYEFLTKPHNPSIFNENHLKCI